MLLAPADPGDVTPGPAIVTWEAPASDEKQDDDSIWQLVQYDEQRPGSANEDGM